MAQTVARWLVMFLHRPGGQTQFASPVWVPRAERSTIRAVQTLVEAAPGGDHRLPALAAAAAMSVRHFTRVFTAEVGETPSRFVERTRLEAARRELEETTDTLDVVAARCGLGSAETLRRVFQRHLGVAARRLPAALPRRPERKDVRMTDRLQIAIPLFPKYTALDAVGPYEVLQRIPTFDIVFVGHDRGEVRSENGMIGLTADATFEDVPHPTWSSSPAAWARGRWKHDDTCARLGAPGPRRHPVHHVGLHRFGRPRRGRTAAGAQRHHALVLLPASWPPTAPSPRPTRVVEHLDERIITSAGVSSGIDMALRLVELLVDRTAAQAAQLMIEYDPQPPFDCGSVAQGGRRRHDPHHRIRRSASRPRASAGADGHHTLVLLPPSWQPTAPSPQPMRVVEHLYERIITSAGVSSGIDMALRLVELLADRTRGPSGAAHDRVRPAAALRLRVGGQGRRSPS